MNDKSKRNVIYFSEKSVSSILPFSFKKFAWPMTKHHVFFVSILKDLSTAKYKIQVAYYKKDSKLYNALYSKDISLNLLTIPKKLSFPKLIFTQDKDLKEISFSNLDVVYLSRSEVIYQIHLEKIINCHPILVLGEKNSLEISCESVDDINKNQEPSLENTLTEGLKRVAEQANPASNVDKNNFHLNRVRRARMLV